MLSQHFEEIFKCLNNKDIVDVFAKRRPVDKVKNFSVFKNTNRIIRQVSMNGIIIFAAIFTS